MWFGENLNENDIVFVWWDYGMWVIYYVRCVLVVELVFNIGVVLYYFGKCDENWVMGFGVDYVIVFYYDFLKFGMIVDIVMMCLRCNVSENYGFVVLFMVFLVGVLVFRNLGYMVVVRFGEKWDVKISVSGYVFGLWEVYVEYGDKIIKLNIMLFEFGVYFYINFNYNYVIFMNGEVFNINLVRFFIKLDGFYELVYFDGGIIKILRFKYLNVVVERRGGEIFFQFENVIGMRFGIWGFFDNGMKVFEKWYNVEGLKEFELLVEVNGMVIRYVYVEGEKILDRGVFRRD